MNLIEFGWLRDDVSQDLSQVTLPNSVLLAPAEVLELIRCSCFTPSCSARSCKCSKAKLPCTIFCKCKGDRHCLNDYTAKSVTSDDDESMTMKNKVYKTMIFFLQNYKAVIKINVELPRFILLFKMLL